MNREKIITTVKGRTKTSKKLIGIIYDNLISPNRLGSKSLQNIGDFKKQGVDFGAINRIEDYLVEAGAVAAKITKKQCKQRNVSAFDLGITWGKFNCLPNGELI